MKTHLHVQRLTALLPSEDHEFVILTSSHKDRNSEQGKKYRVQFSTYLKVPAIQRVLWGVDPNWTWEFTQEPWQQGTGALTGIMTVCGTEIRAVGASTTLSGDHAWKASETDAFKRAAAKHGVGYYLWEIPKDLTIVWADGTGNYYRDIENAEVAVEKKFIEHYTRVMVPRYKSVPERPQAPRLPDAPPPPPALEPELSEHHEIRGKFADEDLTAHKIVRDHNRGPRFGWAVCDLSETEEPEFRVPMYIEHVRELERVSGQSITSATGDEIIITFSFVAEQAEGNRGLRMKAGSIIASPAEAPTTDAPAETSGGGTKHDYVDAVAINDDGTYRYMLRGGTTAYTKTIDRFISQGWTDENEWGIEWASAQEQGKAWVYMSVPIPVQVKLFGAVLAVVDIQHAGNGQWLA